MKQNFLFFFCPLVISCGIAYSQTNTTEPRMTIESFIELDSNDSGEQDLLNGIYLIDSLESISPILLSSRNNNIKYAVMGVMNLKKLTENILENENIYLYTDDRYNNLKNYSLDSGQKFPSGFFQFNTAGEFRTREINENPELRELKYMMHKPAYYLLFLIKGELYNIIFKDINRHPIDFADPKAYYPMLVPVFRN